MGATFEHGAWVGSERLLGYAFRKLLAFSRDRGLADSQSFVIQYLALAFFTIGVASNLGMDDLLAAFAAGTSNKFFLPQIQADLV